MVKERAMTGTGFFPLGREEAYAITADELFLVGTSEVPLVSLHCDETLDAAALPIRYAGVSNCFRREAGAYGKDTKGLYRVHQFTKVEMFGFTTPERSDAMHEEMLGIEEEIFQGLGLPYRVVDICTGDLGGAAYRKYDLEAWMPGRDAYGEITSTSNTTDYQARRLQIRYRKNGGRPQLLHTLNGTAIAVSRALIPLLENYQQEDGSIRLPEALVPYAGKKVLEPAE
jgi:seryl-tRNA synthetase